MYPTGHHQWVGLTPIQAWSLDVTWGRRARGGGGGGRAGKGMKDKELMCVSLGPVFVVIR